MSEFLGKSLNGRYQIKSLLGEGGMGGVYKAFDPRLQREVAIKVMHRRFVDKSDFQDRFAQEAVTAAKFSHPGIVQIFDYGQAGTVRYIVMEFIAGENLEQMIRRLRNRQQWITLRETVELIRYIAQALDYAHQRKVFHRDVKPANIMLKAEAQEKLPYRPVITDLGLAKLAEGGLETQIGLTMGTPAYMSPEQTRGHEVDARTDIYSVGVLLYELAVGQLPFPIKSMTEAVRYHGHEKPPTPRSIYPELPPAVEAIILRALEKSPNDRFPTAGELAHALEDLPAATVTDTLPPTAIAGASSLLTQWQESFIQYRGPSLVVQPPPGTGAGYQLLVRLPYGREVAIKLTAPTYTLGRQPDNSIEINDARASRYHARLDYQNGVVWVTDLDSTNGTFLGKRQLDPHSRTPWDGKEPLQIGKHTLLLQEEHTVAAGDPNVVTSYEPPNFEPAGVVALSLTLPLTELAVEPGQRLQVPLVLQNQGNANESVVVALAGIPREWLAAPLPILALAPGEQQRVVLTIQPPRTAQSSARPYLVRMQAYSQRAPDQKVNAQCELIVKPYLQFQSALHLRQTGGRSLLQVQVENQGNATETFQLTWREETQSLTFTPPQLALQVANGQQGVAEVQIKASRRPVAGGGRTHTIRTQIFTSDGQSKTQLLDYRVKPLLSGWFLALLLILLIGGGAWRWQGAVAPVFAPLIAQLSAPGPATSPTPPQAPDVATPVAANPGAAPSPTLVSVTAAPLPSDTPTAGPDLGATQTVIAAREAQLDATETVLAVDNVTRVWELTATAAAAANAATATQVAQEAVATQEAQAQIAEATRAAQAKATADAAATAQQQAREVTADAQRAATAAALAAAAVAATATAAVPTPTPIPPPPTWTPTPARPGQVTGFEAFGQWTLGNEPWATFVQSTEQHAVDSFAGKLAYDFTTAETSNDYVVFLRRPPLAIPGQPKGLKVQIYGDGSGNILNAWVLDNAGIIWAFTFGKVTHQGWQEMGAPFDPSFGWPNGIVQGGSAASPTFPLAFYAFVLDGEPRQKLKGEIFIDELMVTDSPKRPNMSGSSSGGAASSPPAPDESISCMAAPQTIHAGQSANLSWNISGVRAIYLDGKGVTGADGLIVNPSVTTAYTLRIVRTDGSETTCVMTVQVN
ncbi:MAG: protein kinase [Caldilineaceae bacterium]